MLSNRAKLQLRSFTRPHRDCENRRVVHRSTEGPAQRIPCHRFSPVLGARCCRASGAPRVQQLVSSCRIKDMPVAVRISRVGTAGHHGYRYCKRRAPARGTGHVRAPPRLLPWYGHGQLVAFMQGGGSACISHVSRAITVHGGEAEYDTDGGQQIHRWSCVLAANTRIRKWYADVMYNI